ncbi:MAG: AbrB family transcriptional regulator [Desulfovibrio sp.]|jgi:membrane AbrB-like protein|nr:AbrB family transcriptional regulator [Desulfovibrio sp.]
MPPDVDDILRKARPWAILAALTAVLTIVLKTLDVPASSMLGSMGAAIVLALRGTPVHEPRWCPVLGQSVIGCLMGSTLTEPVLESMAANWPMLLACVLFAIVNGLAIGLFMMARGSLPGTTAIWGTSPGAAAAMVFMSAAYGADMRLVAIMQYLRVVLIAVSAVAAAMILPPGSGGTATPLATTLPPGSMSLLPTLALILGCAAVARRIPFGAAPIVLPMVLGALLQHWGVLRIEMPHWLLAIGYALLGWSIGLRFDREILRTAMHLLWKIVGAIAWMMGSSACLAVWLVLEAGIDPVTAYLATSPGGLDSTTAIAASCGADLGLVVTIQAGRMLVVSLVGPPLARLLTAVVPWRDRCPPVRDTP